MRLKLLLIVVVAVLMSAVLVIYRRNLNSKGIALDSCLAQLTNQKPVKIEYPKPNVKDLIM